MATNYQNFSVSRKKAQFYQKANQPTDGYEEVTYGTEGKKTYHKYQKSVEGFPTHFGIKEIEYEGRPLRFLEISLTDGDTLNKISLPLKNKGGYTDEVKKVVSALNGADLKEKISFSMRINKYTNSKGQEKEDLAIYGNYPNKIGDNDRPMSTGYISYDDIPKPTSKVVAGDTTWDFTTQTEFFYNKINELTEKFNSVDGTSAQPKAATTKTQKVNEPDDLPF